MIFNFSSDQVDDSEESLNDKLDLLRKSNGFTWFDFKQATD